MRATVVLFLAGAALVAADCQDDGCGANGVCCLCSCNAGDYAAGSFSCNCDSTSKHKPLPNADQPACCGGSFGFDAWCVRQNSSSVKNLECTNQTTAGIPSPPENFYQFGTKHRCVYPPHTCNSGFCDNAAVPDLADKICHKPYVPSPAPSAPASKPAPSKSPSPAGCDADSNRPIGCKCDHSFQCRSDWCTGTCQKQP
mmetsp:Transcript_2497/g.3771  ORF Transcript_2497/g.3771 Transcript_2497/m.3771 type:complete len:199 (-) Transcript_2497:87-683(-)